MNPEHGRNTQSVMPRPRAFRWCCALPVTQMIVLISMISVSDAALLRTSLIDVPAPEFGMAEESSTPTPLVDVDKNGNVIIAIAEWDGGAVGGVNFKATVRAYKSDGSMRWSTNLSEPGNDPRPREIVLSLSVGDLTRVRVLREPVVTEYTLDSSGRLASTKVVDTNALPLPVVRVPPKVPPLANPRRQHIEATLGEWRLRDAHGRLLRQRLLPSLGAEEVTTGLRLDPGGNTIVSGLLAPQTYGLGTWYVIKKISPEGELIWMASNDPDYPRIKDGRVIDEGWPRSESRLAVADLLRPPINLRNVPLDHINVDRVVQLPLPAPVLKVSPSDFWSVSPDSRSALVCIRCDQGKKWYWRLWHYSFVSQEIRLILDSDCHSQPEWSPDSSKIAFQSAEGQIMTIDIRTGARHLVTESADRQDISWAWDSQSIWLIARPNSPGASRHYSLDGMMLGPQEGATTFMIEDGVIHLTDQSRTIDVPSCFTKASRVGDTFYCAESDLEKPTMIRGPWRSVSIARWAPDEMSPDGTLRFSTHPLQHLYDEELFNLEWQYRLVDTCSKTVHVIHWRTYDPPRFLAWLSSGRWILARDEQFLYLVGLAAE